jgi:hypothetical protein
VLRRPADWFRLHRHRMGCGRSPHDTLVGVAEGLTYVGPPPTVRGDTGGNSDGGAFDAAVRRLYLDQAGRPERDPGHRDDHGEHVDHYGPSEHRRSRWNPARKMPISPRNSPCSCGAARSRLATPGPGCPGHASWQRRPSRQDVADSSRSCLLTAQHCSSRQQLVPGAVVDHYVPSLRCRGPDAIVPEALDVAGGRGLRLWKQIGTSNGGGFGVSRRAHRRRCTPGSPRNNATLGSGSPRRRRDI